MEHDEPQWNLREGMIVLGADGGKIGQVVGVQATFFVVEKGWLFPTDYYIPADAIQRVDADTVHLTVPRDDALHQGWDVLPVEEAEALHRDAAAAGTTLGGYTAEMGKMVADVDVQPTDVAAALEHPEASPVAPEIPPAPVPAPAAPNDVVDEEPAQPAAVMPETEASLDTAAELAEAPPTAAKEEPASPSPTNPHMGQEAEPPAAEAAGAASHASDNADGSQAGSADLDAETDRVESRSDEPPSPQRASSAPVPPPAKDEG